MSRRGSSSDRRRGHPSGGPGLNQLAQSASHRERSSVIYMRRPGLVATGRAWQGSALTERSNSMDENGTNSSSPASPIWLICVVPAVAAHVDTHEFRDRQHRSSTARPIYHLFGYRPQCIATSQNDAPDRAVVAPRRCWAARRGAAPKRRRKGCPARVPGPALAGGCPLIEAPVNA